MPWHSSTIKSMLTSPFENRRRSVFQPSAAHCGALLVRDYKEPKCVVVGQIEEGKWGKVIDMHKRVYDPNGIAPTLATCSGGNTEKKIIVDDLYAGREQRTYEDTAPTLRGERHGLKVVAFRGRPPADGHKNLVQEAEERTDGLTNTITTVQKDNLILQVKTATRQGYEKANEGDSVNLAFPNSQTRRGRVGKQVSQTLDTNCQQGVVTGCTIRKLTPTECWRLMGWTDEQIAKVKAAGISNAQMYRQAGNGIVVTVLETVFKNLLRKE